MAKSSEKIPVWIILRTHIYSEHKVTTLGVFKNRVDAHHHMKDHLDFIISNEVLFQNDYDGWLVDQAYTDNEESKKMYSDMVEKHVSAIMGDIEPRFSDWIREDVKKLSFYYRNDFYELLPTTLY